MINSPSDTLAVCFTVVTRQRSGFVVLPMWWGEKDLLMSAGAPGLLFPSLTEQGLGITLKCNVTKNIFDSTVSPQQDR